MMEQSRARRIVGLNLTMQQAKQGLARLKREYLGMAPEEQAIAECWRRELEGMVDYCLRAIRQLQS